MTTKAGRIKLERAHRVLAPKPDPNKRPRTLLIHFHSFRDKQRVMEAVHRLSSEDGGLWLNGSMVSIDNDFSTAVLKKPKAYDAVKLLLRERGIQYTMFFPATVQVTHNGSRRRFSTPGQVQDFLASLSD